MATWWQRPRRAGVAILQHGVPGIPPVILDFGSSPLAWVGMRLDPDVAVAMVSVRLFVPPAHPHALRRASHLDRESRRLIVARAAAQSGARESLAARAWQPIERGELRAVLASRTTAASDAPYAASYGYSSAAVTGRGAADPVLHDTINLSSSRWLRAPWDRCAEYCALPSSAGNCRPRGSGMLHGAPSGLRLASRRSRRRATTAGAEPAVGIARGKRHGAGWQVLNRERAHGLPGAVGDSLQVCGSGA